MRKYQGMTFIGMLFSMAVVVILAIIAMRVVPVYIEYYSVVESVDSLKRIPASEFSADPAANAALLKEKLVNQLYVNSITLPADDIKVVPTGNSSYQVSIKYQVIKPLFANASLLFNFDQSKEVTVSAR